MIRWILRRHRSHWATITHTQYAIAWNKWGGSVATHPDIVRRLSNLCGIETKYLAHYQQGQISAVLATWGRYTALSQEALEAYNKEDVVDLGKAEVIIPQAPNTKIKLKHKTYQISELHLGRITNMKSQRRGLSFTKAPHTLDKKLICDHKRRMRKIIDLGGKLEPITKLAPDELAYTYSSLFEKRWGFEPCGKNHLTEMFSIMQPYLTGKYLTIKNQPAAVQIIYRTEALNWISVEYINDGIDPQYRCLGTGAALNYENIMLQWEYAQRKGKELRSSFGSSRNKYKKRWCNKVAVYSV